MQQDCILLWYDGRMKSKVKHFNFVILQRLYSYFISYNLSEQEKENKRKTE